jgi:hypothetical protein
VRLVEAARVLPVIEGADAIDTALPAAPRAISVANVEAR